jgi:hypothetical protein
MRDRISRASQTAADVAAALLELGLPVIAHSEMDAGAKVGVAFMLPNGKRHGIAIGLPYATTAAFRRAFGQACMVYGT